jgi:segregation and condensation protein A
MIPGILQTRSACTLHLPVFEGPLDLLLHLIRGHKLDISEVALAAVAEQYIQHLGLMDSLDLEAAGEFLVIAATLMEIKSRSLLPRPEPLAPDEEGLDPRAELVARLLEYERFQEVAEQLRVMATEAGRSFPRPVAEQWEGAIPLVELRPEDLLSALRLLRADEEADGPAGRGPAPLRVRRQAINLRQRMAEVLRRVYAHEGPLPFSLLVTRGGSRLARAEVLVTFLAVLELVRLGDLTAWQRGALGDILLTPRAASEAEGGGPPVAN